MLLSARRLVCSVVGVVVGVLVFASAPALAAVEAPEVSVQTPVPATSATVHGVLDPGKEGGPGTFELGRYEFLYSKTSNKTGCRGEGKAPVSPGISLGAGKEEVTETLPGLEQSTEYTVCLLASNEFKEQASSLEVSFRTESLPEAPEADGLKAEPVSGTSEMLHGVLNPKNAGEAGSYEFVYRDSATECQGEGEEKTGGEAHGIKGEVVSNEVGGLSPNTQYSVCLLARNEAGEMALSSPSVTFTTLPEGPSISDESVSNLGSVGVTLNAEINIGGLETTYSVQYGTSTAYGSETTTVSTTGSRSESVALSGLQPSTEYHFRFIATNGKGTVNGGDMTFTTYSTGISGLPDGRVYEMVSPPENHDADVYEPASGGGGGSLSGEYSERPFRAAADGDSVAYIAAPTIEGSGSSGSGLGNEYLATRSPQGGWSQANITPGAFSAQYQAFSNDLTTGFVTTLTVPPFVTSEHPLETQTVQEESSRYNVLYTRASTERDFHPLFTVIPDRPTELLAIDTEFGNLGIGYTFGGEDLVGQPVYAGSSADSSHVLFEANAMLLEGDGELERELSMNLEGELAKAETAERLAKEYVALNHEWQALPTGSQAREERYLKWNNKEKELEAFEVVNVPVYDRSELYMSVEGRLGLVNVSPEGKLVPGATFGGPPNDPFTGQPDFSNVISADGSRVFWTSVEYVPTGSGGGQQFEERPKAIFVRENGSRTVQVSPGPAQFWTASPDGGFAYYTEAGVLWRFDVENETRKEIAGSGSGVQGVIGTNETGENGAYVYFVAQEALTNGKNAEGHEPIAGEDNLYVDESQGGSGGSKIVFIGTLSGTDSGDWSQGLGGRTATLTPNGQGLVFVSHENLTGGSYPEEGSEDVYVFDADGSSLFCASCRSQASGGSLITTDTLTNTYRWISEDGDQVFFDSSAPLVSRDVNSVQDVYEWERDGSGTCAEASGCVYLISNGVEGYASLVDASSNGSDVFFVPREKLVPEGDSEYAKLYDARVDGALPVAVPQCTGTGCQGLPAAPPTFATPASATFDGVGNFPRPVPVTSARSKAKSKPSKCKKGYVKNKDKCVKRVKAKKKTKKAQKPTKSKGSK